MGQVHEKGDEDIAGRILVQPNMKSPTTNSPQQMCKPTLRSLVARYVVETGEDTKMAREQYGISDVLTKWSILCGPETGQREEVYTIRTSFVPKQLYRRVESRQDVVEVCGWPRSKLNCVIWNMVVKCCVGMEPSGYMIWSITQSRTISGLSLFILTDRPFGKVLMQHDYKETND